jgi:hypothetical protein
MEMQIKKEKDRKKMAGNINALDAILNNADTGRHTPNS